MKEGWKAKHSPTIKINQRYPMNCPTHGKTPGIFKKSKFILYRGFLKWWYPQIIHFNGIFHYIHYKPSIIWGTPIYGNPQIWVCLQIEGEKDGRPPCIHWLIIKNCHFMVIQHTPVFSNMASHTIIIFRLETSICFGGFRMIFPFPPPFLSMGNLPSAFALPTSE